MRALFEVGQQSVDIVLRIRIDRELGAFEQPTIVVGALDIFRARYRCACFFVCKLRKKLSAATGGDNYIETVWGRGYVLRDPQEETTPVSHETPAVQAIA